MKNALNKTAKRAVLVSIDKRSDGLYLSLDDVKLTNEAIKIWEQADHFTAKQLPENSIEKLDWSEAELADFGYHILSRLHAFRKMNEM